MHDLVIRNGTLVDGTGAAARVGDVGIDGDRISAVGDDVEKGHREVDADGRLVTPGWVDMHTHYDAQVTWDPELTPSGWHGVTTVVMGNCGVGFAPAAPDRRDWLIGLMEGVEDIPGAAMTEGIRWEWESYPEYLDALSRRPAVMDFGSQIPHGALRAYVMEERGAANEDATVDDISEMVRLVGQGLDAGALGFSTSRTSLHRSIDGELVPGTFAAHDELYALGEAIRDAGHGVFQMALEHADVPQQFEWLRHLGKITGHPVLFNLQQIDPEPDLWRECLRLLEQCGDDGLPVFAQAAGRPIGILMSWEATAHPFLFHQAYQEVAQLPFEERLAALRAPARRQAILDERLDDLTPFLESMVHGFDKMWPFTADADYEPDPADSVAAVAEREGRAPAEVVYDTLMSNDGKGLIYFPLFNYSDRTLDPLREMHLHPRTFMGLADAGAHCGAIADGGMPTFMVSYWTRDRARGERLPLEFVVHRQTQQTARVYGLEDRGVLAPGYRADVNVIDGDAIGVEAPRMAYDLPTGARRYVQRAHGYVMTLCRGEVVAENGEFTGATPGRLIRGPQPTP